MTSTFKKWVLGGLNYLRRYYKQYLLVVLITVAIQLLESLFFSPKDSNQQNLILLAISIVNVTFFWAMQYGLYKLNTTGKVDMSYWGHFFRIMPEMILGFIIIIVIAAIGLVLSAIAGPVGIICFAVFALIVSCRFMFFPYLMLEYDMHIKDAFTYSRSMTESNTKPILMTSIAMALASLAAMPFMLSIEGGTEVGLIQIILTGIIYGITLLIFQPLFIATQLFGYAQMHDKLMSQLQPETAENSE